MLLACVASCSDFLEVQPKTEIREDKMFENESGFKEALIGCYMLMGETSLYGKDLTVCLLDAMGGQYEMETTNTYYRASQHDYDLYEGTFSALWQNQYKVIANVNALLGMIEKKGRSVLHPTNLAIIKGEALGLRAFLHFDLLRMFGWGDLRNHPENLDRLTIPYVVKYHKSVTKQSTEKEVLQLIHNDLEEAERLLGYYDSYGPEIKDEAYELPNEDGFYKNRRNRMNYYAVRALLARVCMWEGNYEAALGWVHPFFTTGNKIAWVDADQSINTDDEKSRDLSYTTEHIFNLDIANMYEPLKQYIEIYTIHNDFSMSENQSFFRITKTSGELLYEIADGTGLSDYRYLRGLDKTKASAWLFLKFWEAPESTSKAKNKMPLIKKPEMFYYAAECYNELGKQKEAVNILNQVRVARGILYEKNLPATLTKELVDMEIEKEWRKEFISEGQMFYYYKRLGKNIPGATVSGDELYIVPLPDREVEIGGREDYEDDTDDNE